MGSKLFLVMKIEDDNSSKLSRVWEIITVTIVISTDYSKNRDYWITIILKQVCFVAATRLLDYD